MYGKVVLKESALISVTGLTELLRQAQVASGSTKQPFTFYVTRGGGLSGADLDLQLAVRRAEVQAMRRRAGPPGLRRVNHGYQLPLSLAS